AVRADPARRGLLYAGTEHGVYVSWNDGATWRSLSLDLPDTQVPDLVVEGNDLVIATHGRSMYVLDDITPIREWRDDADTASLRLMPVPTATRGVDAAAVQYALGRRADTVQVEILDGAGRVIRTFTGGTTRADSSRADSTAARATPATPADTIMSPTGCETPRRRQSAARPGGQPGLNRFAWDLRYPGATTFDCMIIWSASPDQGPVAPPGRYQVRVTANGIARTQPVVVRMDPRLRGVSAADLREQFDLAMRIRDRVSAANDAVLRIRRMRSQLAARVAQAPELARQGDSASRALRAVEERLYQVQNRSGQDPLNYPIRINNRMAALGRSVQSGDARPTAAAYVVFRELSAELDVELRRLDAVVASDVAAFDRSAVARGLAPLIRQ
ncbi:MAG TPA: hypothetical protein VFN38_17865, partial [Gemmatimonadaceae bacterium]|nr:hypothetical protein [Gemmatimonadaceae bacterium]